MRKKFNYTLFRRRLKEKRNVVSAFTSVYGINSTFAIYTTRALGFSPYTTLKKIPPKLWDFSTQFIDKRFLIDRQLTRISLSAISEHVRNGSYKGWRFIHGLPVHGQRTHSNGKTAKRLYRGMFKRPVKVKGDARQRKNRKQKK